MKHLLFLVLTFFATNAAFSQCVFAPSTYQGDLYPSCDWQTVSVSAGERWHMQNQTEGVRYTVSLCPNNGGFTSGTWDSELTVHGDDGLGFLTFLGYNNDFCNIRAKLTFNASSSNFASVKIHERICQSNSSNTATLAYREAFGVKPTGITLTMDPNLPGNSGFCEGDAAILTYPIGAEPIGYDWYWQTSPNGTSTALGSNHTLTVFPTSTTTYYLRPRSKSVNQCWGNVSDGFNVPVMPQASLVLTSTKDEVYCNEQYTVTATVTGGGICSTIDWQQTIGGVPQLLTSTSGSTGSKTFTANGQDVIYAVQINTYNCYGCYDGDNYEAKLITQLPDPSVSISSEPLICSSGAALITADLSSLPPELHYNWQRSTITNPTWVQLGASVPNSGGSTATYITDLIYEETFYRVGIYVPSSAQPTFSTCNIVPSNVISIDTAGFPISATGGGTICAGGELTLSATSSAGVGCSYQWQISNTGGIASWTNVGTLSASYNTGALASTKYYRVKLVCNGSTCSDLLNISNIITVTVEPDPTISISGSGTICAGGDRTLSSSVSNGTGFCFYYWYSASAFGGPYTSIPGANAATFNTGGLNATQFYKAATFCNGLECDVAFSNAITVNVVPVPTVIASGGGSVCSGGNMTLTATSTGGVACSYQWQESLTGLGSWTTVGTNSATYNTGALTVTKYYRVQRICNGSGCNNVYSAIETVTVVPDPTIIASGGGTICSGGDMTFSSTSTGGIACGYQWQESTTGLGSWTNVGTNSASFNTGALTATKYYRVQSICTASGCDIASSNIITATVEPDPVISAAGIGTICIGGNRNLNSTTSGGIGCSYQWQSSTTGSSPWVNVGTNSNTHNSGALSTTTYFRVQRICTGTGCDIATSGVVSITVKADQTISASGGGTICSGGDKTLTATSTGGVACSYQWQESLTGLGSWTTVGTNSATYNTGALTVTKYYRVQRICNGSGCDNVYSATETVSVIPKPTASGVGSVTICEGTSVSISGVSASNGTINWTHDGAGSITAGQGTSAPTYTPAAGDLGNLVTLTITVSNAPCADAIATYAVQVNPNIDATLTASNELCPTNNNGQINVVLNGGLSNVRYIRVVQLKETWLNLAEISAHEIFTGSNIALGATATQSTIYGNNAPVFGPAKLTDGDTGNFMRTKKPLGQWVRVDLGSAFNLDTIVIHNRSNCCQNRADSLRLELYDASNTLIFTQGIDVYQGVNSPHSETFNVLDVSWLDAATSLNRSALDAGNYTLNYSDVSGCADSEMVAVGTDFTESSDPTSAAASLSNVCSGEQVDLSLVGGSLGTNATWEWYSDASLTTNVGSGASISINPTSTKTYYVRVEGLCNNTSAVQTAQVIVYQNPSIAAAGSDVYTCVNVGSNLSATAPIDGIGTWSWSPSAPTYLGATNSNSSVAEVAFSSTGTYTGTWTTSNGPCSTTYADAAIVDVYSINNNAYLVVGSSATGMDACDDGQWTYYANPTQADQYIFGIKKNGNSFTAQVEITDLPGATTYTSLGGTLPPDPDPKSATHLIGRYWNVTLLSGAINTPVDVRFFVDPSEIAQASNEADITLANTPLTGSIKTPLTFFKAPTNFDPSMMLLGDFTFTPSNTWTGLTPNTVNGITYYELTGLTSFSGGGAGFSVNDNGSVLPVELLEFNVSAKDNNYITADWTTATEINNDGFELLRSTNGVDFETIAWIPAKGNSNEIQNYNYDDFEVIKGITYYYQLKQIDFNGQFEFFNIVSARLEGTERFYIGNLIPNPIKENKFVSVDIQSETEELIQVKIYSHIGVQVDYIEKKILSGYNNIKINISHWASGTYFINFESSYGTLTRKLVVIK